MNNLTRPHLFGMLAGLFLAAGLVVSSRLATAAWLKVNCMLSKPIGKV
jgi:hypothetical protein